MPSCALRLVGSPFPAGRQSPTPPCVLCVDIDHNFWGRPQEQPVGSERRPAFIWTFETPASDLLGTVSLCPTACCCIQRPVAWWKQLCWRAASSCSVDCILIRAHVRPTGVCGPGVGQPADQALLPRESRPVPEDSKGAVQLGSLQAGCADCSSWAQGAARAVLQAWYCCLLEGLPAGLIAVPIHLSLP